VARAEGGAMSEQSLILDARGHPQPLVSVTPAQPAYAREDLLGDLLYFHLVCARQSAARLDRMPEWDVHYELEFSAQRAALSRARATLRELTAAEYPIPDDLIPMLSVGGLIP
jgi:hypothetical protein